MSVCPQSNQIFINWRWDYERGEVRWFVLGLKFHVFFLLKLIISSCQTSLICSISFVWSQFCSIYNHWLVIYNVYTWYYSGSVDVNINNTWIWLLAANNLGGETYNEIAKYRTMLSRQFYVERKLLLLTWWREDPLGDDAELTLKK